MIKFEEHDDNLFRMLEEPVPLTDDAELPVLVRLIQDDTMLGKANKRSCHPDTLAQKIICSSSKLTDDGLFMDGNYTYRYEIIGTLVEEGSAEWRNKQLQDGKPVHKEGDSEFYQVDGQNRIIGRIKESGEFNSTWNATTFMRDESDGWRIYEPKPEPKERPLRNLILWAKEQGMNIRTWYQDLIFTPESLTYYLNNGKFRWWNIGDWELTKREANMSMPEPEPKPLLADAKVGDLCKRSNGRYTQFHSKHKLNDGSIAYYFTDASGSTDIDGNHCIHECGNNIVSCEPLATEGTVEWAWQMLNLLRLPVYHPAEGVLRTPIGYDVKEFVRCYAKTGWQIYKEPKPEPKPKPTFKVGDWVEVECQNKLYHKQVLFVTENRVGFEFSGTTPSVCFDGTPSHIFKFIRKLSPSEVIVKIGCLSGTIKDLSYAEDGRFWFIGGKTERCPGGMHCILYLEMLDTPTRKLVESLLKAMQEEEK